MINLSEIYDVTLKRGNREAAKGGFVRPTVGENFMTHRDFEHVVKPFEPIFLTKILAPDGATSDLFGVSVATSDTKIVVGAYHDDNAGGSDAGSAYIFNTDGSYVTKITAPDGAATDYFGYSVAISDTRIVVGAPSDDNATGTASGAIYIFNTDGTYITKIIAPSNAKGSDFGCSVALSNTKIVVGAYNLTNQTGAAYIFNMDGSYVAMILAPDRTTSDYFGYSVAISDTRVVVGAYSKSISDYSGIDVGAAYIFNTDGTYVTKIMAPNAVPSGFFGRSVAVSDTKVFVGANGDVNAGGIRTGSVYIFTTDGAYVTKIIAPDGAVSDSFGYSVAISDTKIVVGAHLDDNTGVINAGSAYIFSTDGAYITKIIAPDGAANDYFGYSVVISDTKIVVGAYLDDATGKADAGSAYIYDI